jgi:serine/threonine protein kinase
MKHDNKSTNQNTMTTDEESRLHEEYLYATRNNIDPKRVPSLPRIPKGVSFSDPKFVGRGTHSEVYSVVAKYKKKTATVALKIFSDKWKTKFEAEVQAYEFLRYGKVKGIVPFAYGYDTDWDYARLHKAVGRELDCRMTSTLQCPVSVLMMEYIAHSTHLSAENVTWRICKDVINALDKIHAAQVKHHDVALRNILIDPSIGRVVWIDFSSSYVNFADMEAWRERGCAYSILYQDLVYPLPSSRR